MIVSDIRPGDMEHPAGKGLIQFQLRILTRLGEVVLDFGEFQDLISYRDSLSAEAASGTFTFRMRASLCNQNLLKKVHPGLVMEAYCARNADALQGVIRDPSKIERVETAPEGEGAEGLQDPDVGIIAPVEDAYLDKAPHLLIRGVITDYGRSSEGGETSLYVTGESYGKIYKDSYVLTDLNTPETIGVSQRSLEIRQTATVTMGAAILYYRILRDWVENFWGEPTGWEARTRPLPFPPNYLARINNEGSAWSNLQYLAVEGFFHMFVDHTGAIVWEKLPYSSRSQALVPGRNWEDLPMIEMPSWKILSWSDRLSEQGITNFLRVTSSQQGNSGGQERAAMASCIYNLGSIKQYGGPTKRELMVPIGILEKDNWYTSPDRRNQQATNNTLTDYIALESIRWFDRPVQRVGITARGESAWRVHTRISLKEDWHCPDAEPAEYYVVSRTHQIDIQRGSWISTLELLRDRRERYLGLGAGSTAVVNNPAEPVPPVIPPRQTARPVLTTDQLLDLGIDLTDELKRLLGNEPYRPLDGLRRITSGIDIGRILGISESKGGLQNIPDLDFPDINLDEEYNNGADIEVEADDYWWTDRMSGMRIINIGGDPIAWGQAHVAGAVGEPGPVATVEPNPTPEPAPVDPNAPPPAVVTPDPTGVDFEPVDKIYRDNLEDESPPGSYDFTLERKGNVITPIPAPVNGTIGRSEVLPGYGNVVEVIGDDGNTWFFAHMDSRGVQPGARITKGQTLGNQGWTGKIFPQNENGSHIHLEISNAQKGAGNAFNRVTDRSYTRPLVESYLQGVQNGRIN
jgi:hypothetical protein